MYFECEVHLCVTPKKTQSCADPCTKSSQRTLIDSILTHNYKIRSGPVSLINKATVSSTTPAKPTQNMKPIVQPATSQSPETPAFCSESIFHFSQYGPMKFRFAMAHFKVTRLCSVSGRGESLFWMFAVTLLILLIKSWCVFTSQKFFWNTDFSKSLSYWL